MFARTTALLSVFVLSALPGMAQDSGANCNLVTVNLVHTAGFSASKHQAAKKLNDADAEMRAKRFRSSKRLILGGSEVIPM